MPIAREEIFGAVATIIPVDGVEQAIEIANDSIYGLAAPIWTHDIAKAHNFARDIEADGGVGQLFRPRRHDLDLWRIQADRKRAGQMPRGVGPIYADQIGLGQSGLIID